MDVVPDEAAVRQLFDDLTVGQPDAPPDRFGRIRRRVRRHRLTQAAGTLAVVAVAAVVAVSLGTSAGGAGPSTGQRSVPAWALPWPDHRNGSAPQGVLDSAVIAWRHFAALDGTPLSATPKASVIWYVGQTTANGQVVVVVFEEASSTGRRLVAGWATASEVMHGQPGWSQGSSPWVLYDVSAPKPTPGLFIGLNVHGTSAQPSRNPDNWIVVLAAPQVQDLIWTAPGPSSTATTGQGTTSSGSAGIGNTPAVRGLAIADTGQITGRVKVIRLDVHRRNTLAHPGYVGVPGSADSQTPQLARPAAIPPRHGFRFISGVAGQGTTVNGLSGDSGRLAIRARCFGPSDLRLTFGTGAHQVRLGMIRCDDTLHELITQVRLRPGDTHAGVWVRASYLTSYRAMIGTVK